MRSLGLQGTQIGVGKFPAGSMILECRLTVAGKSNLGRSAGLHSSLAITARVFTFADGGCKIRRNKRSEGGRIQVELGDPRTPGS